MISISEQKKKALSQLKGNWSNPVITTLLFFAISISASIALSGMVYLFIFVISLILSFSSLASTQDLTTPAYILQIIYQLLGFAVNLLVVPLSVGIIKYFLMFSKSQKPDIVNLFDGYKHSFDNSILASILVNVYTFLWTLLLIVPGIIKKYAYSMTFFIIADEPNISANEAIKKSEAMMKGYKWNYFLLQLSFIGWSLLAIFTCGIGFLWLTPYMQTASSHFYLKVKEEYENKITDNQDPLILEEF